MHKGSICENLKFYRLPQPAFRAIAIKFTLRTSSKLAVAMKFQASSRDKILRRILKKSRACPTEKSVNLAQNFTSPYYLAAIKYACQADAVKFHTTF